MVESVGAARRRGSFARELMWRSLLPLTVVAVLASTLVVGPYGAAVVAFVTWHVMGRCS